jgi:hypothetical protein
MIEILPEFMLIVVPGLVVLMLVRDQAAARRSGMSDEHPVCPKCCYRLGGWPSPVCPECGADVTVTGVRVGPQTGRWSMSVVLALVTVFLVGAVVSGVLYYTSAEFHGQAHARYESNAVSRFHVTVTTEYRARRGPTRPAHHTSLILTRLAPGTVGGWRETGYTGTGEATSRRFEFDHHGEPPGRAAIREAVCALFGDDAGEVQIELHTDEVVNQVDRLLAQMRRGTMIALNLRLLPSDLMAVRSHAASGYAAPGWQMTVLTPIVVLLAVALVLGVVAYGYRREGWRAVRNGEWGVRTA